MSEYLWHGPMTYGPAMPWISVDDVFATPPRFVEVSTAEDWSGELDLDRGWAELVEVSAVGCRVDVEDCSDLSVTGSYLGDAVFDVGEESPEVEIWRSRFENSDLSALRVSSVRSSTFVGCKFVGTDFAEARLDDVKFERCTFRYTNLRMAKLNRVEFSDCVIDDVDLYDSTMEDVAFPMSRVVKLNVDRIRATRVDLRDAAEVELASITRLDGVLVGEDQLPTLMYSLAFSLGLGVERPEDHESLG